MPSHEPSLGGVNNEVSASDRSSGSGHRFRPCQISSERVFVFPSFSHTSSLRRRGRKDNRAGGQGGLRGRLCRGGERDRGFGMRKSGTNTRPFRWARGLQLNVDGRDGGPGRGLLRTQAGTSAFPLADCELYGELSGYRSEHIRLPDSRDGGIVQVGVITLHPVSPEHGFSVSVTSLAAPEKAKKSLQKGQQQAKQGKWAAAADYFKRAVEDYPRYALA